MRPALAKLESMYAAAIADHRHDVAKMLMNKILDRRAANRLAYAKRQLGKLAAGFLAQNDRDREAQP